MRFQGGSKCYEVSRHGISPPLTDAVLEWFFVKRRGVRRLADGVVKSDKNKINL